MLWVNIMNSLKLLLPLAAFLALVSPAATTCGAAATTPTLTIDADQTIAHVSPTA